MSARLGRSCARGGNAAACSIVAPGPGAGIWTEVATWRGEAFSCALLCRPDGLMRVGACCKF